MWVVNFRINHDCTIGNRCKKFSCETLSTPLTNWSEKGFEYVLGQHILIGKKRNIDAFFQDLKKDSRCVKVEKSENVLYLLERHKKVKIPARAYHKKMFFVKPVHIGKDGVENWELCSFEKEVLLNYIKVLKKETSLHFTLDKIVRHKIKDVFFPKVLPFLSRRQKEAFELAVQEGYYSFPRKINLKQLAKAMDVSLPTFQEHLRKAESKAIPFLG